MKFRALTLGASIATLVLLSACDDDKKNDLAKGIDASPAASAQNATASAVPSAALSAAPAKKVVVCPSGTDVPSMEPSLEAEVRKKARKDGGALTRADLKGITSINLSTAKVDSLDPCVFPLLTGMKDLFLGPGELEDLSPLSTLTNLETLRASINHVADLKPLTKLTKMDRLDLGRTAIRDIAPLATLVNLTELQLDDTQVTDLAPLATCTKLERLSIKNTAIADLSPLKNLKSLKKLNIAGTPITDISVIQPLIASGLRIERN